MIGFLTGILRGRQPPELLLDVNGVGYEVLAPMTTIYDLPENGREVSLFIHMVVREDVLALYGFLREGDRALFRNLIKVNGVGAKLALTILSGMDAESFARCVQEQDTAALVRLPGVGKKTAERLVVELRDRLGKEPAGLGGVAAGTGLAAVSPVEEAVSALVALGYKPNDASRMVRSIDSAQLDSGEIIRRALQEIVR